MKRLLLVYTGIIPPILFWATNLFCGMLITNYKHSTMLVSELGTLGTSTQYIFSAGLILCSLFSICFIAGLYMTAKRIGISVIPIVLLSTYSFSILGAALFPFPLKLHGILGMPALALFLSPLMSCILWQNKDIANIKMFSFIALVTMSLGFLVYAPNIMKEFFGIKQRFFHLGWTFWFIYLSIKFGSLTFHNSLRPKPSL